MLGFNLAFLLIHAPKLIRLLPNSCSLLSYIAAALTHAWQPIGGLAVNSCLRWTFCHNRNSCNFVYYCHNINYVVNLIRARFGNIIAAHITRVKGQT